MSSPPSTTSPLTLTLAAAACALAACGPAGPLVLASEGATLTSEDGAFVLVLPPGALREDTHVSIRRLAEDEWPRSTRRAAPIGEVYAIEPAGLALRRQAWAAHVFDAAPGALSAPGGDDTVAAGYVRTPEGGSRAAVATRTVHLTDGRAAIVATVLELGVHWASSTSVDTEGEEPRNLHLSARLDAEAGAHAVGEPWRVSGAQLSSDAVITLLRRDAWSAVTSAASPPFVAPLAPARTWERYDAALGLHPLELFGARDGQSDAVSELTNLAPVTLEAGESFVPLVDPLPGFSCTASGASGGARLFVGVDVVSGASSGTVRLGLARELGGASCD